MTSAFDVDQLDWLQEAIGIGFQSCDVFGKLNIVQERKFLVDSTVAVDAIWQTPRAGRSGAGLLVEMPKIRVPKPNSQVNELQVSVVILEERNLNLTPVTGTGVAAEKWSATALEFLRGWIIGQAGGITPDAEAVTPARDWFNEETGVIAYRVSFTLKLSRVIIARCAPVAVAVDALTVTLTTATGDAEIYYTLDGTAPGSANPAAMKYTEPFAVAADIVVLAAAYAPGKFPSNIAAQTIT